jgi:hypothetical protein
MDFFKNREGYGFLSHFPPFSFSANSNFTHYCRNSKRLREFEEIEISMQRSRGDCE